MTEAHDAAASDPLPGSSREGASGEGPSSSPSDGGRFQGLARRVFGWLLVATFIAIPTYGRVSWELAAERERATAAEGVGDRIIHLGRAARWKLPLASGDEAALDELMALGREHAASAEKDVEARLVALASLREARAAILARRGPIQWAAERERLHELDVEIADLMALEELRWYGPEHAKDAAWHLERLAVASSRTRPFAVFAALSFLVSVAGLVAFLLVGLDDRGRLRRPWGFVWLAITIGGTAAWLLLLGRDAPSDGPRTSDAGAVVDHTRGES